MVFGSSDVYFAESKIYVFNTYLCAEGRRLSCAGFSSLCPQIWSILILNEISATTKQQRKADVCAVHCRFHTNISGQQWAV